MQSQEQLVNYGTSNMDQEQIRKALEFAKNNPNDPTSKEIVKRLRAGTFGVQRQLEQKQGFLKSIVTEPLKALVVKPAVRLGQVIAEPIARSLGATEQGIQRARQTDVNFPGIGKIEAVRGFGQGATRQIAGEALEAGSYLLPAARAEAFASKLFGGQVLRGIATGAIEGGISGSALGAGTELQKENATPDSVIYNTLFNGAIGTLAGGAFGGTFAGGANIYNKIKSFKNPEIPQLTSAIDELLNITPSQSRLQKKYNKNAPNFIARELGPEARFKLNEKGKLDTTDVADLMRTKYEAEELAFDTILDNTYKYYDLDVLENRMINQASNEFKGTAQQTAIRNIRNQFDAYKNQFNIIEQDGRTLMKLNDLNSIKRDLWTKTKFKLDPTSSVISDSNYLMGHNIKEAIESSIEDANIKAMNSRLGDFINAIEILEKSNGKTIKGGRLGQYFGRVIGAAAGATGGPVGSIAGAITGDRLASLLANPEMNVYAINRLMSGLSKQERKTIVEEAAQILAERAKQMQSTLKIPAPGGTSAPIITPAPTTYEAQAGKIFNQSQIDNTLKLDAPQPNQSNINQGRPIKVYPRNTQVEIIGKVSSKYNRK